MIANAIAIGIPAIIAAGIYVRSILAEQDEHDARTIDAQRRRDRLEAFRQDQLRRLDP